jgi:hypothetical protein
MSALSSAKAGDANKNTASKALGRCFMSIVSLLSGN